MSKLLRVCIAVFLCLQLRAFARQTPAAPEPATQSQAEPSPKDPVLTHRPAPRPPAVSGAVSPEGRLHLDVLVTDDSGVPVSGLEPMDFKLLDNGQPRRVLSFRSFDGVTVKPDPPVEVILLLDTANAGLLQLALTREQIEKFLRRNGGHLAQPVSILLLTDAGLRVQPRPSTDGNALVELLAQIKPSVHTITSAMGSEGMVERFKLSGRSLALIADNERKKPGRKLLLWIGPGWPLLRQEENVYSQRSRELNFDSIVSLTNKLREARIALYSVGGGEEFFFQDYLKGVITEAQAASPNLALQVLAVASGGRTMDAGNGSELADQIDKITAEASAFYRLSFDPPPTPHADEYHELKIEIGKPGLTARTNTGYYNQP